MYVFIFIYLFIGIVSTHIWYQYKTYKKWVISVCLSVYISLWTLLFIYYILDKNHLHCVSQYTHTHTQNQIVISIYSRNRNRKISVYILFSSFKFKLCLLSHHYILLSLVCSPVRSFHHINIHMHILFTPIFNFLKFSVYLFTMCSTQLR